MKHRRLLILRCALPLLLALLMMPLGLRSGFAQSGAVVRSIDVEYSGPKTVSREEILSQMRTTVGQPYSDDVVEQDIRNLYKTGMVHNVRIFGSPSGDGVKVTVVVQTRP